MTKAPKPKRPCVTLHDFSGVCRLQPHSPRKPSKPSQLCCGACGHTDHADHNAAELIAKKRAIKLVLDSGSEGRPFRIAGA